MSKSRRNWMLAGSMVVSAVALGASVAVGVGFWTRPPSPIPAAQQTQRHAYHVEQKAEHEGVAEPLYFVLAALMIEGTVPAAPTVAWATPWRTTEMAGRFPSVGRKLGQSANADMRNPGVRIYEGTTGQGKERAVTRPARRRLPLGSSLNLEADTAFDLGGTNSLASEINARRPEIGRCAGQRSIANGKVPPPSGKLALRWIVRTDGSSNAIEVRENTLGNARFSKCVLDTVGRWKFSPRSEGDAPVESTFVFL